MGIRVNVDEANQFFDKGTITEFANRWQVEKDEARGLILFLLRKHCVEFVEKRPAKGGKGKPSNVYRVPRSVQIVFFD